MRTIKFRGKVKTPKTLVFGLFKEGTWVYGEPHLFTNIPHIHISNTEKQPIDINTLGQFTGLTDKNGSEIYEGDIVVSNKGLKGVIIWSCNNASFQIEWRHTKLFYGFFNASIIKDFEIRVIGNIHDNPITTKTQRI